MVNSLLVGKAGSGKSTIGNALVGKTGYFATSDSGMDCTDNTKSGDIPKTNIKLWDTPGFFGTTALKRIVHRVRQGLNGVLMSSIFVIICPIGARCGPDQVTIIKALEVLYKNFPEAQICLIFTHDDLQKGGGNISSWINKLRNDSCRFGSYFRHGKYSDKTKLIDFVVKNTAQKKLGSITNSPILTIHKDIGKILGEEALEFYHEETECYDVNTSFVYRCPTNDVSSIEMCEKIKIAEVKSGDYLAISIVPFKIDRVLTRSIYSDIQVFYSFYCESKLLFSATAHHFVYVVRKKKKILICAQDVLYDDFMLRSSKNGWCTCKITFISRCVGVPGNIRTTSLQLLINDVMTSSRFLNDSGTMGHSILKIASSLNSKFPQMLHDFALRIPDKQKLKLCNLLNNDDQLDFIENNVVY